MAKTLYAFDFDNTLVVSNSKVIVKHNDGEVSQLTPYDYVGYVQKDGDEFDFSEFSEIKDPKPVKKYMDLFKKAIKHPDADVTIITARGIGSEKQIAKYLKSIGITKDVRIKGVQSASPRAKSHYITNKIKKEGYTTVRFFDDHEKNVDAVKGIAKDLNVDLQTHLVPKSEYEPLIQGYEKEDPTKKRGKNVGKLAQLLKQRVTNPNTGNQILIKTALKYGETHPAHQIAKGVIKRSLGNGE